MQMRLSGAVLAYINRLGSWKMEPQDLACIQHKLESLCHHGVTLWMSYLKGITGA